MVSVHSVIDDADVIRTQYVAAVKGMVGSAGFVYQRHQVGPGASATEELKAQLTYIAYNVNLFSDLIRLHVGEGIKLQNTFPVVRDIT
jgi:hypothetical protein